MVLGILFMACGLLILLGQKTLGGMILIQCALVMMATKDNPMIKSDVAAINREKDVRRDWFFTDVSLIGVGLLLIGGMGSSFYGPKKWYEEMTRFEYLLSVLRMFLTNNKW